MIPCHQKQNEEVRASHSRVGLCQVTHFTSRLVVGRHASPLSFFTYLLVLQTLSVATDSMYMNSPSTTWNGRFYPHSFSACVQNLLFFFSLSSLHSDSNMNERQTERTSDRAFLSFHQVLIFSLFFRQQPLTSRTHQCGSLRYTRFH